MYPKILTLPPTSFVSAPIPGADASLSNLTGVIEPSIAFIKGEKEMKGSSTFSQPQLLSRTVQVNANHMVQS
jgi:hypothetical protein